MSPSPRQTSRLRGAKNAVDRLLAACPVLGAVVSRAQGSHRLSRDELLAIRHSVGHLPDGPRFFNELLRPISGVRPDQLLRRPLGGSPISCSRLLKRVVDDDRWRCQDCDFGSAALHYASPLLHVEGEQEPRDGQGDSRAG